MLTGSGGLWDIIGVDEVAEISNISDSDFAIVTFGLKFLLSSTLRSDLGYNLGVSETISIMERVGWERGFVVYHCRRKIRTESEYF